MSKKLYKWIVGVTGGLAAIASASVAYFEPSYSPAIIGSIGIVETESLRFAHFLLKVSKRKPSELPGGFLIL
jgi:hypothetical protein